MADYIKPKRGSNRFVVVDKERFNAEVSLCESNGVISEKLGFYIMTVSKNVVAKMLSSERTEVQEGAFEELVMKATEKILGMNYKDNAYAYFISMLRNTCINYITRNLFDAAGNTTKLKTIGFDELNDVDYENIV
jgi:hypothetical protein